MKKKKIRISSIGRKAEKALQEAVSMVVKEHRRLGLPLAVMRKGKVAMVPADKIRLK